MVKALVFLTVALVSLDVSVTLYINREINQPNIEAKESVYYFAYGSNMSTRYMTNLRQIAVYKSFPGKAINYAVKFNLPGIKPVEPAFANLIMAKGKRASGVVHKISKNDLTRLRQSESDTYRFKAISVQTSTGDQVKAFTFVGEDYGDEVTPSRRYLSIMLEGAREHKLPQEYIEYLMSWEGVYIPVISELAGMVMYILVITLTM